jgi:hypothetical protein
MILGLPASTYTLIHVILSLIGIASGLVVLAGLIGAKRLPGWTALFLATTILTSVTGFGFPNVTVTPGIVVGIISLVVLAVALAALYVFHLAGHWRWIYVASAVIALYLNSFVGVVQSFQKVAPLHAMAPTQSEPPFAIAQILVLAIFIALGILAAIRFRPAAMRLA